MFPLSVVVTVFVTVVVECYYRPQCVTLTTTAVTLTAKTGAPLARHKNRNSFRFSAPAAAAAATATASSSGNTDHSLVEPAGGSNNNNGAASSSVLELVAPLRDLYKSTAMIRVVYANKEPALEASYDLNQLRIHETKWVILVLSTGSTGSGNASSNGNENNAPLSPTDGTEEEIPPTIRVKLTLSGPYRPEIAAVVAMAQTWFRIVDGLEQNALQVWQGLPKAPFDVSKALVLPVPLLALTVVLSPVLAAVIMVSLPFLLPLVLIVIAAAVAALCVTGSLVFSTRWGRHHLGTAAAPIVDSFLHSRAGQTTVYDIGPRPTPVSVAKQILPTDMWGKLVVSLLIDLVGSSSYLLPVLGELTDVVWAPLQTIFIMAMYNNVTPNLKYVSFFEELLPFTDVIPTASIGWACQFVPQLLGNQNAEELAQGIHSLVRAASGSQKAGRITKKE